MPACYSPRIDAQTDHYDPYSNGAEVLRENGRTGRSRLKGVAFQNKCEQRYHEAGEQVANGLRNFQHEVSWLELGSLIPRHPALIS